MINHLHTSESNRKRKETIKEIYKCGNAPFGFKKGCIPWNKGKPAWNKGKIMIELNPNYFNPFLGKIHTEETKNRMKKPHKKFSQENKLSIQLRVLGENNPNWKRGLSFIEYPPEFDKELKNEIKQRDGNRCKLCGSLKTLSIHHIDYNKNNNWEGNLITLCQKCNPKMNRNRNNWREYWKTFGKSLGGIMSDWNIKRALKFGWIKIESKKRLHISPSSVDLHLSPTAKILKIKNGDIIDTKKDNSKLFLEYNFSKKGYIDIFPNEFYLLSTMEKITLNKNISAFVHGRSSIGRLGLIIELAGFVDPQFSGTITMEVSNFTNCPIRIYKEMRICQILFLTTTEVVETGYGEKIDSKYQNQIKPVISKIDKELK